MNLSISKTLKTGLKILVVLIVFVFVGHYIGRHGSEVTQIAFHPRIVPLTLAFPVYALSSFLTVLLWTGLLRLNAQRLPLSKALAFCWIAQLGKYIPGKIWLFAGRIGYCVRDGIPLGVATLSVIHEQIFILWAGVILGLGCTALGLPASTLPDWSILAILVLGLLGVGNPVTIRWVTRMGYRLLKKTSSPFDLRGKDYIGKLLQAFGIHGLMGLSFFLVVQSFDPLSWKLLPIFIGIFALAWFVGFVSLLAPAGLGVREGILLALLSNVVRPEVAIAGTLLHRLLVTAFELLAAGVGVLLLKSSSDTKTHL